MGSYISHITYPTAGIEIFLLSLYNHVHKHWRRGWVSLTLSLSFRCASSSLPNPLYPPLSCSPLQMPLLLSFSVPAHRRQTYWRRRRQSWKLRSLSCRRRRSAWSLSWWPTSRTVRSLTRSTLSRARRTSFRSSPSFLPRPYSLSPMWAWLWKRTLSICLLPTQPIRLPHSPSIQLSSSKSSSSFSQG